MKTSRLVLLGMLLAGIAWAQPKAPFILDVELQVVSVDLKGQQINFRDADSDTPYIGKVDKKTKLKAKKKVFRGKLKLEDLKKGDVVQVKMLPEDSRLLEVRLLKRAQGP
jgi:hypothetical protein